MSIIKYFLNKTQNQPIDLWFFFLFLLTWPFTIRKVALYFPVKGEFNEYTGIYVYISDIFLFLAILFWIALISYNYFYKSSNFNGSNMWITSAIPLVIHKLCSTPAPWKQNVPRGTFCFSTGWNIFVPLLLVLLHFLSIIWSDNQAIALFRSIKLLEYFILYIYIIYRFMPSMFHMKQLSKSKTNNRCSTCLAGRRAWNIFIAIILFIASSNSIIGISQFVIQQSIGIRFLKESILSPDIPGVAKVVINNAEYIRAYGLFPHPNILGGFLLFSIILTVVAKKCSTPAPLSDVASDFTGWNTNDKLSLIRREASSEAKIVSRETFALSNHPIFNFLTKKWFVSLLLAIEFIALGLTFSKSAIIGLILSILYLKIVPRGTIQCSSPCLAGRRAYQGEELGVRLRMFHVEQFTKIFTNTKIILTTLIILTSMYLINIDTDYFINQSITERLKYLNVSRGTILDNPILGTGAGQFILNMNDQTGRQLENWQLQPVHNVFLLLWSEVGIIGFILFGLLIYRMFHVKHFNYTVSLLGKSFTDKNVPRGTITEKALSIYHFLSKKLKRWLCRGMILPTYALFKPLTTKTPKLLSIGTVNNVPRGTMLSNGVSMEQSDLSISKSSEASASIEQEKENFILCNNNISLSSDIPLHYFKAILLGFTFIMLFDHYFWDIQQGSIMLWIILGLIAGSREN